MVSTPRILSLPLLLVLIGAAGPKLSFAQGPASDPGGGPPPPREAGPAGLPLVDPAFQSVADSVTTVEPSALALEAFLLGTLRQSQGRYPEALREFRKAYEADSTQPDFPLELARTHFQAGQMDSALIWTRPAARLAPEAAEPLSLAGLCLIKLGRGNDAVETLRKAHVLDPADATVVMNLLSLLYNQSRFEEALGLVSPSLPPGLGIPAIYQRRAALEVRLGRREEALRDLAWVVRREPKLPEAESMLHRLCEEMGNPLSAAPLFEGILEDQPDLSRVRFHLCRILMTSDRWREAEPHLEILLRDTPADWQIHLQLGLLLFRDNRFEKAASEVQEAARLAPQEAEPLRWCWRVAMRLDRGEDALAASTRLLALAPDDLDARTFEALSLKRLSRNDDALAAAQSVLAADPRHRDAGLLVALILVEQGKHRAAAAQVRRSLETYPTDHDLRFQLGVALERAGAVDSSLAVFDQLIKEDPDDTRALNYAGYTCIDQGIRLKEAMKRIERALQLSPENPAFLDSYGWGWFRKGKKDKALKYLTRAAELAPGELAILKHLGQAQQAAGRPEEARVTFEKALQIEPDDTDLRRWLDRPNRPPERP
jgi:tetratricopeptide (TPR) repeat protein